MPQPLMLVRGDASLVAGNAALRRMICKPTLHDVIHPGDSDALLASLADCGENGTAFGVNARFGDGAGEWRWMRVSGRQARPGLVACQLADIQELMLVDEQKDILARELAHRIRNIFAVINSLLMLSSRNRPEARPFAESSRDRIEALARAHDYIHPGHGPGVSGAAASIDLSGLLSVLLEPYGDRIRIAGSDLSVGSSAATSLALVFHELATNATKHGSLSSADGGEVSICARRTDEGIIIDWVERGGPPLRGPPDRSGFGTTLAERALRNPLGGTIERSWLPEGLFVRLKLPLDRLCR